MTFDAGYEDGGEGEGEGRDSVWAESLRCSRSLAPARQSIPLGPCATITVLVLFISSRILLAHPCT